MDLLVIRFVVLPAGKDDANPFVREAPDRCLMCLVLVLAEVLVISFGPLRLSDRMKSKLVEGLPQKRGTSPPEVDPTGLAAGLLHGRDATVALHFEGTVVALAMRPQGHDQTRHQYRTAPGSEANSAPSGCAITSCSMRRSNSAIWSRNVRNPRAVSVPASNTAASL